MFVFNGLLSDAAAAALLGASILCLVRGRYLQRSDVTSTGLALLVLATMRWVLGDIHGNSVSAQSTAFFKIVVISGGSAVALVILFNASYGPTAVRQIRAPSAWFVSGIVAIGSVAGAAAFLLRGDGREEPGFIVLAAAIAVGWLILTYHYLRSRPPVSRWLPIVLGLTAAGAVARIPASLSSAPFWLVLPNAIAVVGAMIAIAGSMLDLRELVVGQCEHSASRGHEQDRLHDVRSILAGLQMATTSLSSYGEHIDAPLRRRLHESVSAELVRLRELIEPGAATPAAASEPISLIDAIRPVLDADALRGTALTVDIDDVTIDARGDEIATIIATLLDNARLYAPAAPVELRTYPSGTGVALEVRDFGLGIDADDRASIFDRGRRGGASRRLAVPGSGLGLYLARHRARAIGGDLTLHAPAGGGAAFVLTIPVAATKFSGRAIEDIVATMDHDSRPALDWMPEMSWLARTELREAAGT